MADSNPNEDEQSNGDEGRQQERNPEEVRDRADEAEPVHDEPGGRLGDLDDALETHEYPTTTNELIEVYGDFEIETEDGSKTINEVLAQVDNEAYDSADDVRNRIQGLINR